jgi:hypothetical protein
VVLVDQEGQAVGEDEPLVRNLDRGLGGEGSGEEGEEERGVGGRGSHGSLEE